MQATNKLIQAIFKLQTEVTRLKADVDRLGSPTDTAEHRQKIAAANARIKASAKHISEHMKQQSVDKQSLQMQKILSNFQVRWGSLRHQQRSSNALRLSHVGAISWPRWHCDISQSRARGLS